LRGLFAGRGAERGLGDWPHPFEKIS
jgi:hypothetical protein